MRPLQAREISAAAFAPFGAVIEGGGYRSDTEEKVAPQALELAAPSTVR
jgi:ureidoglycolate hydrolase